MYKDFGSSNYISPLVDGDVSLKVLSWKQEQDVKDLANQNKEQLEPYKLKNSNVKVLKRFGIFFKDSLVGSFIVWETEQKETAISFWVDKNHYRKKIASKAVSLVTKNLFETTDVKSIFAHIVESNIASRDLVIKQGFFPTHRKLLKLLSGDTIHTVYQLDKEEVNNA